MNTFWNHCTHEFNLRSCTHRYMIDKALVTSWMHLFLLKTTYVTMNLTYDLYEDSFLRSEGLADILISLVQTFIRLASDQYFPAGAETRLHRRGSSWKVCSVKYLCSALADERPRAGDWAPVFLLSTQPFYQSRSLFILCDVVYRLMLTFLWFVRVKNVTVNFRAAS